MKRKLLSLFVILCLAVTSVTGTAFAGSSVSYKKAMDKTQSYITENLKEPTIDNGDWMVLGLARNGVSPGNALLKAHYSNAVKKLKTQKGELHPVKYTDYSRTILVFTALGKDPSDAGGYNLLKRLADFNKVKKQGINGPIWALIALDSGNYKIPTVKGVSVQTTRNLLIDYILDAQLEDGGFALSGEKADPDMTGMALQALAKYYKDKNYPKVTEAVDKALDCITYMQKTDGGFASWGTDNSESICQLAKYYKDKNYPKVTEAVDKALDCITYMQKTDGGFASWGTDNSESICQIIVALTALGINPEKDERFIRNGNSAIDALLDYYVSGGGFKHTKSGKINGVATEQGFYALTAYQRLLDGKNALYDMTDTKKPLAKPAKPTITSLKSTKTKTMTVKWKNNSKTSEGYQIRYAANSKFTGSKAVTVTSAKASAKTIKSLKKGKTYYVKVRAYRTDRDGSRLYGNYSAVKKVKVK